jgi:hypothetical protein
VSLIRSYNSVLSTKFTLLAAVTLSLFGGGANAFAAPSQAAPFLEIHRIADIFDSTHLAHFLYLGIFLAVVGVLANGRGAELVANTSENPHRSSTTPQNTIHLKLNP